MVDPKSRPRQAASGVVEVARHVVKTAQSVSRTVEELTPHGAMDDVREVLRKADARLNRVFRRTLAHETAHAEPAGAVSEAPLPESVASVPPDSGA